MPNTISTPRAPRAIGPYSQAVAAGGFVFVSGQIALDPGTGQMVKGPAETQADQVLKNLKAIVEAAGSSLDKVVKTTIYLTRMDDFAQVNQVYARYFGHHRPARATVSVAGLPKGAAVEIEAVAQL